jgi:hypothetical protein
VVCAGGPNALGLVGKVMGSADDGSVWTAGQAGPDPGLTTMNAWQPAANRHRDSFIIRYCADGQETLVATYLGGSDAEAPTGAAVAPVGDLVIIGTTQSWAFPAICATRSRIGSANRRVTNSFLLRLAVTGRWLEHSIWLGGAEGDETRGIDPDAEGDAYAVGDTYSTDFPMTKPAGAVDGLFGNAPATWPASTPPGACDSRSSCRRARAAPGPALTAQSPSSARRLPSPALRSRAGGVSCGRNCRSGDTAELVV